MKLLLDTHTFVWRMASPDRLSERANAAIDDPEHTVLVSAASAWEIATKTRIGKLPGGEAIVAGFAAAVRALGADELPVSIAHALTAGMYEQPHRDPFDRMLAAQAATEGAAIVTADAAFDEFPAATFW